MQCTDKKWKFFKTNYLNQYITVLPPRLEYRITFVIVPVIYKICEEWYPCTKFVTLSNVWGSMPIVCIKLCRLLPFKIVKHFMSRIWKGSNTAGSSGHTTNLWRKCSHLCKKNGVKRMCRMCRIVVFVHVFVIFVHVIARTGAIQHKHRRRHHTSSTSQTMTIVVARQHHVRSPIHATKNVCNR